MFKKGDIIIYIIVTIIFSSLLYLVFKFENKQGNKIEIYEEGKLKYIYKLTKEQKIFDISTIIGGITVEIKENKVRVTKSNSPKKICVKQGWISKTGQTIIGIPDRIVIKISGEEDLDYIIR